MQALRFIERLPSFPSSAWAVRPSAASARAVAVRCGRWLRWSHGSSPVLPAKQVGFLCLGSSIQTAKSVARSSGRVARQEAEGFFGLWPAEVAAPGQPGRSAVCSMGLTEETANTKRPVRQSRRAVTLGSICRSARRSTAGWPASVGASSAPNPSVKGTCLRQAPYVER